MYVRSTENFTERRVSLQQSGRSETEVDVGYRTVMATLEGRW